MAAKASGAESVENVVDELDQALTARARAHAQYRTADRRVRRATRTVTRELTRNRKKRT